LNTLNLKKKLINTLSLETEDVQDLFDKYHAHKKAIQKYNTKQFMFKTNMFIGEPNILEIEIYKMENE
jgi:hypothetical protein